MNLLIVFLDGEEELYEVQCCEQFIRFYYRKKNPKHRHPYYPYSSFYSIQKKDWNKALKHDCPEDSGR
jgi:hypothetical protein